MSATLKTTNLRLNCFDPTDEEYPYPKQVEYLGINRYGSTTTRSHWVGGRGSAKTTTGVLLAYWAAFVAMPGLPGIWTEPSTKLCKKVFMREWQKIVPSELYDINWSDLVVRCVNGSTIDVCSRNSDNPHKEMNKGPNYAWAIEDESAYKFDMVKWEDIDACVRIETPYRFHDTLSTPKMNEYYDLCNRDGHNLVHATSYDNPYIPQDYATDLAEQMKLMGSARYAQEIEGQWIALTGRIWKEWSDKDWPTGNIYPHRHDFSKPFDLFFDLGVASSAWVIVQAVEPVDYYGRRRWTDDPLWVITAEYTPKRDGSVESVLQRIKRDYGEPRRVVAGADLNTRSSTTAETPQYFVTQAFGPIPIIAISGWIADKEIQFDRLSYLIHNTKDERRLCVSKFLKSHDPETKRGVMEMVAQDVWDDRPNFKSGVFLPKEGRLEHIRDALLYGAVGAMAPPRYMQSDAYAA